MTGSLPIGFMVVPFTARGDGRRLSLCSPRCVRASVPATEMLAPESGKVSMSAAPFKDVTWMRIVGAG